MKSVRDFFVRVSIYCIGSFLHLALYSAMIVDNSKSEKFITCVCKLEKSLVKSKN